MHWDFVIPLLILLILLFLDIPIALSLFFASMIGFCLFLDVPLMVLAQNMISKLDSFTYLAVLFFILVGNIMAEGGMAKRIADFSRHLLGSVKGGLPLAAIIACFLFGAICGSGTATIAAISLIMVPLLGRQGYDRYFSIALTGASGTLGMIVPPSVPMIIYAMIAGTSIAKIFMAGYLPAVLIVASLGTYSYLVTIKQKIPLTERPSAKQLLRSLRGAVGPLLLIILIFAGIFGGIFSATEAGAVAVAYALIVEAFIYRDFSLRKFTRALIDSVIATAAVMFVVGTASSLADFLATVQFPTMFASFAKSTFSSPALFLLILNLFLLVVGTFLEIASAIIMIVPAILPAVSALGIDPIHFGIIFIVNLCVGYLTPPVGMSLFVAQSIFKGVEFHRLVKATLPIALILLADLMIITYVPSLSLVLPRLMH